MDSFSLKNEYFNRLVSFCASKDGASQISSSLLELKLCECSIHIPVEFGASLSSYIYSVLQTDSTTRYIDLNPIVCHRFRNSSTPDTIKHLLEDNDFEVNDLNHDSVLDFFEFGCDIGCTYFILPLIEQYSSSNLKFDSESENSNFESTLKSVLTRISHKSIISKHISNIASFSNNNSISPDQLTIVEELSFVSSNFTKASSVDFFVNWCLDSDNTDFVERIISDSDFCVDSEDSLLSFILLLSSRDSSNLHLLSHIYSEYCSIEGIRSLIDYIDVRFSSSFDVSECHEFINILSRRCLYLNSGSTLPTLKGRHSHKSSSTLSPLYEANYDSSDPKRGILHIEYDKKNIDLIASSIDSPNDPDMQLSDLFKWNDSYYGFATKSIPNSSITASIKDNKTFTINKYMIRGNHGNSRLNQLRSWVIKGKVAKTNEWIEIDRHTNEFPFNSYEIRTFDINNKEHFDAVQIVLTGPNSRNSNYLYISGFEVYGQVYE